MCARIASAVLLLLRLSVAAAVSTAGAPAEQLHIAYGNNATAMSVAWATKDAVRGPPRVPLIARYGLYGSNRSSWREAAASDSRQMKSYLKHRTVLGGLVPGARYEYEVEGGDGVYANSSFIAQRADTEWSPRVVMFGDLGWTNDQLLPYLGEESAAGSIDAIVLFGDMVYWPSSTTPACGQNEYYCSHENSFMRDVQYLSGQGSIPFHVSPGNGDSGGNFSIYRYG